MSEKKFFMNGVLKETADGPVLTGNKCPNCNKVYFPKADFCPKCFEEKLEERELSRKGSLFAYTITRIRVANFEPPYPLGLIFLSDDQISIMSPLLIGENEKLEAGTEMETVVAPLWTEENGTVIYGYKFKKCEVCD
jgi:uncharacterized protein